MDGRLWGVVLVVVVVVAAAAVWLLRVRVYMCCVLLRALLSRSFLARFPKTKSMASMTLDLPEPLGLFGIWVCVVRGDTCGGGGWEVRWIREPGVCKCVVCVVRGGCGWVRVVCVCVCVCVCVIYRHEYVCRYTHGQTHKTHTYIYAYTQPQRQKKAHPTTEEKHLWKGPISFVPAYDCGVWLLICGCVGV